MWPDTWAKTLMRWEGGTLDHKPHGQRVESTRPINNSLYLPFSPFLLMLPTEGELGHELLHIVCGAQTLPPWRLGPWVEGY